MYTWIIRLIVLLAAFYPILQNLYISNESVTFNQIEELLKNNDTHFSDIIIDEYKNQASFWVNDSYYYYSKISQHGDYGEKIKEMYNNNSVSMQYVVEQDTMSYITSYILYFAGILMFFKIVGYLISSSFSDSPVKIKTISGMDHDDEDQPYKIIKDGKLRFTDVIGQEEAKRDLRECVNFFKYRKAYQEIGYNIPKGLLFTGPPGTGKTLLAKAFAGEADVTFISICGSDFMEVFVGTGQRRVKELFKHARENSPAVIFIDEIDTIGRRRSKGGYVGGHSEQSATLNKLLVEIDGFTDNDNIMVIAATNMSEILDPALTRSGRFDKEIIFEAPNKDERKEMFNLYIKKIKMDHSVTSKLVECLETLSLMTAGLTGADIANIVNQSAGTYLNRIGFDAKEAIKSLDNSDVINDDEKDLPQAILESPMYKKFIKENKVEDSKYNKLVQYFKNIYNKLIRRKSFNNEEEEDEQGVLISEKIFDRKTGSIEIKEYINGEKEDVTSETVTDEVSEIGVQMEDIIKSIDIVMVGMEKRERQMTDKEKEIVAYHEAGHALVAHILRDTEPPIKVSIIPRGKSALGFTQQEPSDQKIYTVSELYSRICVLLGGKTAEYVKFGHRSTGASDDIEKLTKIAHNMVSVYGMSNRVGSLNFVSDRYSDSYGSNISAAKKKEIDYEVYEIVRNTSYITKNLLEEHKEALSKVAAYLLEHEVLTKDVLEDLLKDMEIKNSKSVSEEYKLCEV